MFGWVRESKAAKEQDGLAAALIEAWQHIDSQNEELGYASYQIETLIEDLAYAAAEIHAARELNADLLGQLESQTNALHVRGRSIDWLAGEVDAAQEDARAAKALAAFWMQSWVAGLGEAPKELSA